MTHTLRFLTLDVFTSTPYSGNPLGVVFLPSDPNKALTQSQKQTIAREFNYSETIFIHPQEPSSTSRKIDIFTVDEELPFAGHPTIGAVSYFLELSPDENDRKNLATLITKAGPFAMTRAPGSGPRWVAAKIAHNVHIHAPRFALSELLGLHPSLRPFLQDTAKNGFPVFSIVKGMSQVFVKLPSIEALAATEGPMGGAVVPCTPASKGGHLDDGWEGSGLIVIYFYVPGVEDEVTGKTVIRSRMFLRNFEDPATGSAASGLAAYLTLTSGEKSRTAFDYHVVQGVEMGRRSDIGVAVTVDGGNRARLESVELRGTAVKVASGEIVV